MAFSRRALVASRADEIFKLFTHLHRNHVLLVCALYAGRFTQEYTKPTSKATPGGSGWNLSLTDRGSNKGPYPFYHLTHTNTAGIGVNSSIVTSGANSYMCAKNSSVVSFPTLAGRGVRTFYIGSGVGSPLPLAIAIIPNCCLASFSANL